MHPYRIGNIIRFSEENIHGNFYKKKRNYPTELAKISEIYQGCLVVLDKEGNGYELREAQPVELTYAILLECGFAKEGDHYCKSLPGSSGLLVYASVTKNNPIGLYLGKAPFSTKDPLQLLSHRLTPLHQLMNLYFAITGEELVWEQFKPTVAALQEEQDRRRPGLKL